MDERLRKLLSDVLRVRRDELNESLTMSDMEEWDSLRHIELISSLENTFGVEFTWEEIVAMQSIAAVRDILKAKEEQSTSGTEG